MSALGVIFTYMALAMAGVLLKLDFEKAYDRVSWSFLREVLKHKGFESGYIHRIMQLVEGGQTTITINEDVGPLQE
jgi:hypothetical protein